MKPIFRYVSVFVFCLSPLYSQTLHVFAENGLGEAVSVSVDYHLTNSHLALTPVEAGQPQLLNSDTPVAQLFIRDSSDTSLRFGRTYKGLLGDRELSDHEDDHPIKLSDGSILSYVANGLTSIDLEADPIWGSFYQDIGVSTGRTTHCWTCRSHGGSSVDQSFHIQDIDFENGVVLVHSTVQHNSLGDEQRMLDLVLAGWTALKAEQKGRLIDLQFILLNTKTSQHGAPSVEHCLKGSRPKAWPGASCKTGSTHFLNPVAVRIFDCNNDPGIPCIVIHLDASEDRNSPLDFHTPWTARDKLGSPDLEDHSSDEIKDWILETRALAPNESIDDDGYAEQQYRHNQTLWRRAGDDYTSCQTRGQSLMTKLQACAGPPNHQWDDVKELTDMFSAATLSLTQMRPSLGSTEWAQIVTSWGTNLDSSEWYEFRAATSRPVILYFTGFFHPQAGIIILKMMYSGLGAYPDQLTRTSDIVFLAWKKLCQEQNIPLNTLKYYGVSGISNSDTKAVALQAYKNAKIDTPGARAPMWPDKHIWKSSEDDGHALLGTPNAVAISWMFIDHYDELGKKMPDTVSMWREQMGGGYGIMVPMKPIPGSSS